MMVPEGILLLQFVILTSAVTGSSDVLIKVPEKTEQKEEGSSVTIPCAYLNKDNNLKLLWFKDHNYDGRSHKFNGTIVYSNSAERPQSPDYSNRVTYITNVSSTTKTNDWIQCNLIITDLQKTDSGNYSFRFIGSEPINKYMSTALSLKVTDNPCKVHVEPSGLNNPLNESEEFTANCSTFASCLKYPEWLVHTSGQKDEWLSSSLTDVIIENEEEEGRNVTKLKLKVTWKDDKRILSCRPAQTQDSFQIRNITLSVEYGPRETTAKVSSGSVVEGESVTLSCDSRGHPNVTFSWFKPEKMEQQTSDLKLNDVKPEDSGEYYCEAKNKHGVNTSNTIIIDVKYGPKDVTVKPLVSVEDLKEGDELKLQCLAVKSNPPVSSYTWYKNNDVLQQTSNTLTISKVTADDGGSYYCQADNNINKGKSNEILVSVKYSPRNVEIQGTHSVKLNSRLTLTCSSDANPKSVQYTWKSTHGLSSFQFSSQTGLLNIKNLTIKHAGQYTCDVTNAIGSRSKTINVAVLYPPTKLSLIMKSEVREFEVFSIICKVESFPTSKLTVTGPQDIRHIQNNRGNITESANKLTMYLNVTESHAGRYKCKAENSEGTKETEQELTVLYAPKNVTASSKGEQTFGSELTLTCEARSKPAPSSFEWMKSFNGQLKTVGLAQKLHFHSLNISDSGQFVCIVNNAIGKTRSQFVDIRVKYAPNIKIVHNKTAEKNWKLAVYLTCSADAYPRATDYKWYREEDNTTVLSDQQNFTVLPQNPGTYYCTAANRIGESRSEHIVLFVTSYFLKVLWWIILLIILLILILAAIFLIRRTIIKTRLDPQSGADNPLCFFPVFLSRSSTVATLLLLGSQNNTQENLPIDEIPDPRVDQSHPTPHSQDPTPAQDLNPRPKSNIHTVYSAIKLPQIQQGQCPPKPQKPGYMDNDLATSTLNYVTLDFKGQNEPKRAPEGSTVYAIVSKNKQPKNSQSEHPDYENVSSACASRLPFTNIDWESDTSEEDEVNYSTVSCSAKPGVKEPKHNQKRRLSSSSSDDEDRTEYSAIKTKTVVVSK